MYIITGLVSNYFYAPCNRVTSSLKKRNHQKCLINLIPFLIHLMKFSISPIVPRKNSKKYIITGLVSNFFMHLVIG